MYRFKNASKTEMDTGIHIYRAARPFGAHGCPHWLMGLALLFVDCLKRYALIFRIVIPSKVGQLEAGMGKNRYPVHFRALSSAIFPQSTALGGDRLTTHANQPPAAFEWHFFPSLLWENASSPLAHLPASLQARLYEGNGDEDGTGGLKKYWTENI